MIRPAGNKPAKGDFFAATTCTLWLQRAMRLPILTANNPLLSRKCAP
jgi:hypothetical protein